MQFLNKRVRLIDGIDNVTQNPAEPIAPNFLFFPDKIINLRETTDAKVCINCHQYV